MTTYTVQIECGDADGTIWQAVAPSDTLTDWDGTAQDLADWTAQNQNVATARVWRVLVWEGEGEETSREPIAVHYHEPDDETA